MLTKELGIYIIVNRKRGKHQHLPRDRTMTGTTLVFENKRSEKREISLSQLKEAQHLYGDSSKESIYYAMERAIRLLTLRYSNHEKSLYECGYAISYKSSEGGGTIASTTPKEQSQFLSESLDWAEALSPRELRKSLCSLGAFRQGWRLAAIVKGDESIKVL